MEQADGSATLTDERIDRIADIVAKGMDGGIAGFCKTWGYRQFARALLEACRGYYRAPGATPPSAAQAEGASEKDEKVIAFIDAIGNGMALSVGDRNCAKQAAEYLRARLTAAPEKLAPAPQQAGQENDEFETRADGKRVRKDRWEWGIRRIVALLWGNRREFDVEDVVEAVRKLLPTPFANGEDEALVDSVGRGFTPPAPQQAAQGGERATLADLVCAWADRFKNDKHENLRKLSLLEIVAVARAAQGERAGVGLTAGTELNVLMNAVRRLGSDKTNAEILASLGIVTTEGGGND